ncbi:MAG: dihydrodipicolinate synthase family protein [Verrucomicrobiae bacterium]|nr:dihydrodipicolinate synthase family protein [Verrucomicrobiae bacterium]
MGIYDRGENGIVKVSHAVYRRVVEEPNVVMIKDSSMDPERRKLALEARRRRPGLTLLNGDEFHCVDDLEAGYDELLLGGGVFNGYLAAQIMKAATEGDLPQAERLQAQMNRIMFAVCGGRKITCWLSGEKKLLVEMGLLTSWRNYPNYPLTPSCCRAIRGVLKTEREALFPYRRNP